MLHECILNVALPSQVEVQLSVLEQSILVLYTMRRKEERTYSNKSHVTGSLSGVGLGLGLGF